MKKTILTILLAASATMLQAQTVSVSPYSVPLWGQTPATAKITASYKYIEATYLYGFKTMYDSEIECDLSSGNCTSGKMSGGYFGLFALSPTIRTGNFTVKGGVGYFFKKYPTKNGTHVNFTLKVNYKLTDVVGIQYSHISNGFGIWNHLNPGVDNISLTVDIGQLFD